jgi:hypothetical protein
MDTTVSITKAVSHRRNSVWRHLARSLVGQNFPDASLTTATAKVSYIESHNNYLLLSYGCD